MIKELKKWRISGYNPCVPLKECNVESGTVSKGVFNRIPAEVPGNVYNDLFRAGIISDPYYGMNSLLCEWVSARWWVYETEFDIDSAVSGRLFLRFESICYKARIYFNGESCGTHANMFTPFEAEITGLYKIGQNRVKVILEHQPDEYSQVGFTSKTFTQKSRYDYKWDFSTRMINVGLLKPVTVYETPAARIRSYYFDTDTPEEPCLTVQTESVKDTEVSLCAVLSYAGKIVCEKEVRCRVPGGLSECAVRLPLRQVKLWYPNDLGRQDLYRLEFKLCCEGIEERVSQRVGFKRLEVCAPEGAPADALPYMFKINGERVYLKGVNLVPMDLMLGTETKERYVALLSRLKDMNVNFIRIWGGGVIESETFYDLCGEYGIMVWQDLIQSSSGIDNFPSHIPEFLENFASTTEYAGSVLRNYVALCAFCGGNELMYPDWRPVGYECPNIASAQSILNRLCPSVPFFPSTPSGPRFAAGEEDPCRNHDVHGEWRYLGTKRHYVRYNNFQCLLHSEFGVDGLVGRGSAEKFMPKDALRFVDMDDDDVWRHHGEWWDCYKREKEIFGGNIQSFDDFSDCSQFIQYEGLRYILECDRFRAWKNVGSIIWQANEPWPNISCTNLIDYYGCEKAACIGVRRAYDDVVASARYDKLVYEAGETAGFMLRIINEKGRKEVGYSYRVFADEQEILKGEGVSDCGFSENIGKISFTIPQCAAIRIRLEAYSGGRVLPNDILWLVKGANGLCAVQPVQRFLKVLAQNRL